MCYCLLYLWEAFIHLDVAVTLPVDTTWRSRGWGAGDSMVVLYPFQYFLYQNAENNMFLVKQKV